MLYDFDLRRAFAFLLKQIGPRSPDLIALVRRQLLNSPDNRLQPVVGALVVAGIGQVTRILRLHADIPRLLLGMRLFQREHFLNSRQATQAPNSILPPDPLCTGECRLPVEYGFEPSDQFEHFVGIRDRPSGTDQMIGPREVGRLRFRQPLGLSQNQLLRLVVAPS